MPLSFLAHAFGRLVPALWLGLLWDPADVLVAVFGAEGRGSALEVGWL